MKLTGKFSNAEAYDRNTGRFSRLLAGQFIDFVGVKDAERLLDIGCGTGSLAFTAAALMRRSEIVGIDRSVSFIEHARSCVSDPRLTFDIGDALSLPYPDNSFDKCLSMLVIQFIPDVRRAVAEMLRVTRQGGAVAAFVWDKNDDELHCIFWDSAAELDSEAEQLRDVRDTLAINSQPCGSRADLPMSKRQPSQSHLNLNLLMSSGCHLLEAKAFHRPILLV